MRIQTIGRIASIFLSGFTVGLTCILGGDTASLAGEGSGSVQLAAPAPQELAPASGGVVSGPAGLATTPPPPVATPLSDLTPARLEIPKIGVSTSLVKLGLNSDGSVEVPPLTEAMTAGWYTGGPAPGQTGPAVLLGHIDAYHRPGVFYRLHELVPGDRVGVSHPDGSVSTFEVYRSALVPKNDFPAAEVYGNTTGSELRLITCGGPFDRSSGNYRDNTIVFADLIR